MAINIEDTRYGLGIYDVHCDLGQRVHQDISAYRKEQTDIPYDSSPGTRRKSKKLLTLSSLQKVATRSLSIQQSAQLTRAYSIKYGETVNVQFRVGEKLIIMFMYNNMYAVYRKSDDTVAILTKAQFQRNPPAMLDGSKYGNLLSDVEFVMMYAVAKTDHRIDEGLKFRHNDVILILAECRDTFVGITARKRVGIFPSNLVHTITKRRMCIFNGMFLRMTPNANVIPEGAYGNNTQHDDATVYEITKSSNGLFSWVTQEGCEISLHALIEKAITPENRNDDNFYDTIHEVSYCGTTLQEKKRMPLPQPGEGDDSNPNGDSSLQGEIWFHGNLSREQAEKVLKEDGDFLVRFMSNFPWVYVLSCKTKTGYEHFRLRLNNQSYYHTNGGDFRSIRNLIQVHRSEGIPVSKDPSTIIRRAAQKTIQEESSQKEDCQEFTYEVYDFQGRPLDNEFRFEAKIVESDEEQPPEVPTRIRFEAKIVESDEEQPPEVPPRMNFEEDLEEIYDDCPQISEGVKVPQRQDSGSQSGEESEYYVEETWNDEKDFMKDRSVKGLIKVFDNEASKSGAGSDILLESSSSEGESSDEEVLSTETGGKSADGPREKSVNECSSSIIDNELKYTLEMRLIKEEIGSLKFLIQSFLKKSVPPENTKQDKSPPGRTDLLGSANNTDEKVETTNESPKKETSKTKMKDKFEEQVKQEKTDSDMSSGQESEATNALEMRRMMEEMNHLKSCFESLMTQKSDDQPKILETYQRYKEKVQNVEKTKEAVDKSEQEESYIDTVVEYEEEEPNETGLFQEMHESTQRRKHLKKELQSYWQMEISDQLRDIVAMYLEPEFFHDVGKKLGVHKNRRTQIERDRTDIVQRTYELLGQWHQKHGHQATIGKLIESLEPFDPEDFNTILEEILEEVEDNYSTFT